MGRKMKTIFRKLGVKVVVLVIVMLGAALVTVNIVSLAILRSFADGILTDRAVVGRQVLEETLKEEIANLEHTHRTLTDNQGFIRAVRERDNNALDRDYSTLLGQSDDYFMVISDFDGNIIYRSASYQYDTYDFGGTNIQIYLNSIVHRDGKLAVMAADQINIDGEDLVLVIGFKLSAGEWL